MKIDITKTPLENIVLQVIEDNPGLTLSATQVTASDMAVSNGAQNTQVTLTAIPGQGFSGTDVVFYDRMGINDGIGPDVTSVEVLITDDQTAVEVKVAAAMGLRLDQLVFSDWTPPVDAGTPGSIGVAPDPTSMLYVGDGVTISITVA
jgi:hypothetical protein